jgi:hypothetical protein
MPINIRFSRHARSRMKLYGIEQTDVELTISHPQQQLPDGGNVIATRGFENKYSGYPLKAVYCRTDNDAFAICHSGRFLAGIQICNVLKSWMPDRTLPA